MHLTEQRKPINRNADRPALRSRDAGNEVAGQAVLQSEDPSANYTSADDIDDAVERSSDEICVAICKAVGWPCDDTFSTRPDLNEEDRGTKRYRPHPAIDDISSARSAHHMYVELTDDKGRRLCIGHMAVAISPRRVRSSCLCDRRKYIFFVPP